LTIEVRELRIPVDGETLAASYSPGGETAIIALHGASAGTRDHPLYRHLHDVLPQVGIGVVTFDRRGEGESTGARSGGNFELQARDALAVMTALDVPRPGLWGFSQGAWVAPLAATMSPGVTFLVLIASTGVTPSAQMMYATAEQLRRAGYPPEAVAGMLDLRRDLEAWIHHPEAARAAKLESDLTGARAKPWWDLAFLPSELPDADVRRAWIAEMDFDPRPVLARVAVPALLFYGTDDAWTPVEESIQAWREARGGSVEVVRIEGASHELTMPDGGLSRIYEERMLEWLASRR
jgi:pimeloyl-ACP methyl ester carboxylesterase